MCAGILGLVMAPLLRGDGKGLVFTWSLDSAQLLGWNMAGMAATIAWTGATTGLVFWGLDNYNMLRWLLSAPKSSIRRLVITEKAPTRAFSWLKAATTAFTFKTLFKTLC